MKLHKYSWQLLSKLSKRERLIVVISTIVVGMGMVDFLAVKPLLRHVSAARETKALREKELLKMEKMVAHRARIESEHQRYGRFLKTDLRDENVLTDFLEQIEKTAAVTHVKILNMNPKRPKEREGYKELSVAVVALADMRQFVSFLYLLERSESLIRVSRLQVELEGEKAGGNTLKGKVSIVRIYASR